MNERRVLRGFIANTTVIPPLIVMFQFNPESVNDNKSVNYTDGRSDLCGNAPGKVYTGGGHREISFDLKLHGLEEGSNAINPTPLGNGISTELAKLRSFLYPKEDAWAVLSLGSESGRRVSSPPTCTFGYGTKILDCVVTSVTVNETQFNSTLAPVRADVSITLTVIEENGNALYEIDKQNRNILAAQGIQNVGIF
ncbi:MAG: hypothetical protein CSB13_09205 [Chloroflexi bacterium]|nr:MAG: hypothetical protein CSB13_09205 [Chloroflexota bacterium]